MSSHDKYPYPFAAFLLNNRNVDLARAESAKQERWVFVPRTGGEKERIFGKIRLSFEPDTLVFVDSDTGIIKLSFYLDEKGELVASGGIFNPKKGKETLLALIDILRYISKIANKKITYQTLRVNRTQHFEVLLLDTGFVKYDHEYMITVEPTGQSKFNYPEVDDEILRLEL